MMKFYASVIGFMEDLLGVKDDDKNGKAQVKFLYWAFIPSLLMFKFIAYRFNRLPNFFKEPGFSELTNSLLSFIADRTGVEFIKNLNIIKFIEDFDTFWSMPIIIIICFILNRHALPQYSRYKNIHYYALLAHMFIFYIAIFKFQWCGLLYILVVFITSSVWYLYYRNKEGMQGVFYLDIIVYNIIYSSIIILFLFLYFYCVVGVTAIFVSLQLWGPSPKHYR